MLYLKSKTGSSPQTGTVKPKLPKTLLEQFRKKEEALIQSMFTAKQAGHDSKVVNILSLLITLFLTSRIFQLSIK